MSTRLFIDASKCVGCRTCEVICSMTHHKGLIEPRRSSVRIHREDSEKLVLLPVIHGAEGSIEYAANPAPHMDKGLPGGLTSSAVKDCNLCGLCAQWCVTGAIVLRKD
jgi:anaerobic carbon-monoxide dehydrogenase iron sulfur subunit